MQGRGKRSWEGKGPYAQLGEFSLYGKLITLSEKRIAHFSNSLSEKPMTSALPEREML
jgi:hypothetical protein